MKQMPLDYEPSFNMLMKLKPIRCNMGDMADYLTESMIEAEYDMDYYGPDHAPAKRIFNKPFTRRNVMSDIVIKDVRFSYLHWAEPKETPSGDLKYSASILILKEDKENLADIQQAIKEAITKGIDDNKFSKVQAKSLRLPLRDGSEEHESGARGKEYDGHFFLNANSNRQPGVVNEKRQPIIDVNDFYSGCFGHAHVNFFPYNTAGNRGIGVGLNNLMKTKDGERLDGRKSAEDAFSEFEEAGPDVGDGHDGDGDDVF